MKETNFFNNPLTEIKPFYRKIFYKCKDFLEKDSVHYLAYLIGPRKIGKTYCLNQLQEYYGYNNTYFYSFKDTLVQKDNLEIIDNIISLDKNKIILLDEVTYIENPVGFFTHLELLMSRRGYFNKVLISGSSMVALETIMSLALATNAVRIYGSFLDFEEWLVFKGYKETYFSNYEFKGTEFKEFILEHSNFTKIDNNLKYVEDCVKETIESNYRSDYNIKGINMELDKDLIISIFYSTLINLHNETNSRKRFDYPNELKKFNFGELKNQIKEIAYEKFNVIDLKSIYDLKDTISLLLSLDLITISDVVSNDIVPSLNILDWLKNKLELPEINTAKRFFDYFNITVKYPFFFTNIMYELEQELAARGFHISVPDLINPILEGSILECYVKGLYSYHTGSNYLHKFRVAMSQENNPDKLYEVDLINPGDKELIEITVSNKSNSELGFDKIYNSANYKKILLTKNIENDKDGIRRVPYMKFLIELIHKSEPKRLY